MLTNLSLNKWEDKKKINIGFLRYYFVNNNIIVIIDNKTYFTLPELKYLSIFRIRYVREDMVRMSLAVKIEKQDKNRSWWKVCKTFYIWEGIS